MRKLCQGRFQHSSHSFGTVITATLQAPPKHRHQLQHQQQPSSCHATWRIVDAHPPTAILYFSSHCPSCAALASRWRSPLLNLGLSGWTLPLCMHR